MRVVLSGSSGLLGSALVRSLEADGHAIVRLVRDGAAAAAREGTARWDPRGGEIDRDALEGCDAVVHLAGEGIFGRFTDAKKERILRSRVDGTTLLARALAELGQRPRVFASASGIGYYGDRGDEPLDESSTKGTGFLADVVDAWESATDPASTAGITVVKLRSGVVLSPDGGALAKMLTPFRLGVGGRVGSGKQWTSWIAIDDWVRAVRALIDKPVEGPVNLVAPSPVTNAELTRTLAHVLHRPAIFPVPKLALATLFGGEATDEMLVVSQRVTGSRLSELAFTWRHPELEGALRAVL